MSDWFCRTNSGEVGPVSFRKMAQMLNSGELLADDLVRRTIDENWQPADDVVGLKREARRIAEIESNAGDAQGMLIDPDELEDADEQNTVAQAGCESTGSSDNTESSECNQRLIELRAETADGHTNQQSGRGTRKWQVAGVWLLGLAVVATSCVAASSWFKGPDRFPVPIRNRALRPTLGLIEQVRLPAPESPSVPGLVPKTPRLVPGCEEFEPIYSPTFSQDLRILVFAQMNGGHLYDLFVATRPDLQNPFGKPQLIQSTQTNETEAYCSLSPDGLELFYVSSDSSPVIFSCSREDVDSEFGQPAAWTPSGWDSERWRVGYPQFVSQTELVFGAIPKGSDSRTIFRVERTDEKGTFGDLKRVEFADGRPPYFVSRDRLRGYFGSPAGLHLAIRKSTDEPFRNPVIIVPARICGPIEGPLWLAPAEDVVFYCGPGPGQSAGSARHMWQMRI